MDFKKLAQTCIDAEEFHAIKHKAGEPKMRLAIQGNQTGANEIHILTAPSGKHLMGNPITYIKKHDATVIEITCRDVREFYEKMAWSVEEFVDRAKKTIH